MLALNDGRDELWQWDTGRTLAVDADCSQVHFSNKVFGRSFDVDVVGGVATIPDILLQTDKDLNVWAFVGTAENGYTKISKTFNVNRRNKPADYVFTPTDQMTLQTIQSQIGDLADLTTEAKDTLVAAINEAAKSGGGGGVELDTTLTQSGKAADAAEVGARLSSLSEEIANIPGGGSGLTTAEKTAMLALFKAAAYTSDVSATITQLETIWNGSGDSGGETDVTLTSISATYSGGDVAAGTALSDLTGIVVTATYSDGSTATVTGYTLSGEITEGSNTITVTYQDKTTTFSVTGTAVSQVYTVTNNLTNVTNSNSATSVDAGGSYSATLTVADGNVLNSVVITMGGVDVTSAVYGEGYILITDVTGDIVITAVAAVPEYVDMATGISTNTVNLYSDAGSTALATKHYQTGAYSLNRTETDAKIRVVLTNNTDSAISSTTVYIGSANGQAIRNPNSSIDVHYAISGSKGSVAAGASVEVEYTVRAGYWLYVCGYGSLDVSVVGVLDVHEPTDVLATTSKKIDSFYAYSDAGTTLVDEGTYRTAYATTEAFDVDTPIRLTVVSGGANTGNILYGCAESGTLTASVNAYYGDAAIVKNFATGAALIIDYTVKAGYYFAVLPGLGATIYIEKA